MFDVVIVGAGSSGSAIAARASENPDLRVLLLEAGPDYPRLDDTPSDLRNGHDNSYVDHDWGLRYRATARGSVQPFPRGRVTGGSSAVNTAIALRGMPEDYDGWATRGNPEWAWEEVLPAFCRLERDLDFGEAPYHGDAGPISIRRYPRDELTTAHRAFLETARELGYPDCPDANDPASWGSGPHPMNKLGRTRVSTAVGYLAPARIRENLEIRPDALARRLIIRNGRAEAVEVERSGDVERIEGRLFVCAAGAIETPALLVRSGLGPSKELDALGIDVAADVPGVGGGYTLLQLLIEEISGEAFEAYMQRAVFEPLGMDHSTFVWDVDRGAELATIFDVDSTPATHYRFTALAAASLYTTVADMTTFIQAHLPGPRREPVGRGVLTAETLQQMRQPHASQLGQDIWGLGTILYAPNGAGGHVIGHDGNNEPAINTAVRLNPATGNGIAILETGNRLLATRLAGEWVFWETGNLDFLTVTMESDRMLRIIAAGWLAIVLGAVLVAWRARRARSGS